MDISAYVPLQDLGFGRRATRLAVQCVFIHEEETRSEFLSLIRQPPTVSKIDENPSNVFLCSPVFWGGDFRPPRGERHAFLRELCRTKCHPLNVILMREQLNVKQVAIRLAQLDDDVPTGIVSEDEWQSGW